MKHYLLRMTFRNFRQHKSTFLINLVGLSSAFAGAILIFLWVNDEKQVDKFHQSDKQLYQVMENHHSPEGVHTQQWTPDLLGRTLAAEMPEVKMETSVMPAGLLGNFSLMAGDQKTKAPGQFADYNFFSVFSFGLSQGNPAQVLMAKNSIVISKNLAHTLFGTAENVIGKTIDWELLNMKYPAVVTGVFEGTPENSTMQFDFALNFDTWLELSEKVGRKIQWGNHAPCTYLVLNKGVDVKQFNSKIENFHKSKLNGSNITLFAVPYSGQYLKGTYENGVQAGGRISYIRLFVLIAIVILLIAGINYMNLSTARSSRRVKEIGIKKVVGSGRFALIVQFMTESVILSLMALIFSVVLVMVLLPQFNQITGKHLLLLLNPQYVFSVLGACLFVAILTSIYPALYLSGFNPFRSLNGKQSNSALELWARKGLVVFQFVVSVVLISSVIVVYKQIGFIQTKNLGYNKDNVIFFNKEGGIAQQENSFLAEARKIDGIVNISSMGDNFFGSHSTTYDIGWEGKPADANISFEVVSANYQTLETMEINLAKGRSFSSEFGNDADKIILNQAAIDEMGLQDPIGKTVRFWGKDKQIIGVVNNFNVESLHQKIGPLLFYLNPKKTLKVVARIEAGREKATLAELGKLYSKFNPGFSFDYRFMDAAYQAQYESENRVAILSRYFAGLGILISCLGLFGLAAFAAEQRIKEIGVRRVNGARISDVMTMLNSEFMTWVAVAFVIATPIAYYAMHKWLESFAYKTELSWWIFALAGLLALGIALLTVSWQSWKAATRNPVEALRYE
ncbi:ABC transporter permease [bacterium]|nr:ABC transporter permease [bacterium]